MTKKKAKTATTPKKTVKTKVYVQDLYGIENVASSCNDDCVHDGLTGVKGHYKDESEWGSEDFIEVLELTVTKRFRVSRPAVRVEEVPL